MNHDKAIRDNCAERYLRGDLEGGECEAFERHYLGCGDCQSDLHVMQTLRDGLAELAEAGELRVPTARRRKAPSLPVWALAATVLLAVGLLSTSLLYQRNEPAGPGRASVHTLLTVRSGSVGEPVNVVRVGDETDVVVLNIDSGDPDGDGPYTTTLVNEARGQQASIGPLSADRNSVISVALPRGRLSQGIYRLEVRAAADSEAILNQARFRVEWER